MDSVVTERQAIFCARLKAAREKKGVSLEQIAASTKISRSLFKGLESHDVSRWPKGLYRRSYLRDYLKAIDLEPESIVAEFLRLFPDEDAPPPAVAAGDGPGKSSPLSMTLAWGRAERLARARKRILAATIDASVVLMLCVMASWVMQADLWATGLVIALGYYSIASVAFGCSLGSRCLESRRWMRSTRSASPAAPLNVLIARFRRMEEHPSWKTASGEREPTHGMISTEDTATPRWRRSPSPGW